MKTNHFEILRILTDDNVELSGMFSLHPPEARRAVLHIHGLAGNFYEQRFVDFLADAAQSEGFRFLSINTRGHEYFSDAVRVHEGSRTTFEAGGAHERLVDAPRDVRAGIKFLTDHGVDDIVLSSHSTGCVKTALYLALGESNSVKGAIFISPSDDVGIQKSMKGDDFDKVLNLANEYVVMGRGDELLPNDSFVYPVDAQAYIDLFDPSGIGNIFDVEDFGGGLARLNDVKVPSTVIFGSDDIALVGDKADGARKIVSSLGSATSSSWRVIDGADHSYTGKERELAELVALTLRHLV